MLLIIVFCWLCYEIFFAKEIRMTWLIPFSLFVVLFLSEYSHYVLNAKCEEKQGKLIITTCVDKKMVIE